MTTSRTDPCTAQTGVPFVIAATFLYKFDLLKKLLKEGYNVNQTGQVTPAASKLQSHPSLPEQHDRVDVGGQVQVSGHRRVRPQQRRRPHHQDRQRRQRPDPGPGAQALGRTVDDQPVESRETGEFHRCQLHQQERTQHAPHVCAEGLGGPPQTPPHREGSATFHQNQAHSFD